MPTSDSPWHRNYSHPAFLTQGVLAFLTLCLSATSLALIRAGVPYTNNLLDTFRAKYDNKSIFENRHNDLGRYPYAYVTIRPRRNEKVVLVTVRLVSASLSCLLLHLCPRSSHFSVYPREGPIQSISSFAMPSGQPAGLHFSSMASGIGGSAEWMHTNCAIMSRATDVSPDQWLWRTSYLHQLSCEYSSDRCLTLCSDVDDEINVC